MEAALQVRRALSCGVHGAMGRVDSPCRSGSGGACCFVMCLEAVERQADEIDILLEAVDIRKPDDERHDQKTCA